MKNNEKLVKILKENNLTITTCESLTGGLVASAIVDVSGSSQVINEAYVTYAIKSKENLVGVESNVIEKYGVVSVQTAFEMAKKAALKANSDVSISTTGIAGPTGGDCFNPVGTVCFGFYYKGKVETIRVVFDNLGRNKNRKQAVQYAIKYAYNFVKENLKKDLQ